MKVEFRKEPFPHVLLSGFYSADEEETVWAELKALSAFALPPDQTASATYDLESGGKGYLKNNLGIFLPDVYRNVLFSPIWRANRKLFDCDFMEQLKKFDFIFEYFHRTNWDTALVQFYADGHYYKAHRDSAVFSAVINFHGKEKEYEGGVLRFVDYDYSVDLKRNECILFPSFVLHEVTPVIAKSSDLMRSRITISLFLGINPK